MPVLVTDAQRPLARRIAACLLEEGGEVRAYADGDASTLRAAGAFVAHGAVDDEGRLEAALAEVHTLIHVGGGVLTARPDRIVRDAEVVATAATNAGVKRIIALSLPGAAPDAADPVRQAKAAAELILADVPCPSILLRTSLVDTPAIRDALATGGLPTDVLDTPVAPVRAPDLVELVTAFDRARSSSDEGRLLVAVDGPTTTTLSGYLERVGVEPPGRGSLLGRRILADDRADHLAAVLRGPWTTDTDIEVALDGWAFAGLEPGTPGP